MNLTSPPWHADYEKAVAYCAQQRECGHIRDVRDTKRQRDVCAVDGIVEYGQRVVSSKGSVRFAGEVWQCELLLPFAGFQVGLVVDQYWIQAIDVYWPGYPSGTPLFRIFSECEGDREKKYARELEQVEAEEFLERNSGAIIRGLAPRNRK